MPDNLTRSEIENGVVMLKEVMKSNDFDVRGPI